MYIWVSLWYFHACIWNLWVVVTRHYSLVPPSLPPIPSRPWIVFLLLCLFTVCSQISKFNEVYLHDKRGLGVIYRSTGHFPVATSWKAMSHTTLHLFLWLWKVLLHYQIPHECRESGFSSLTLVKKLHLSPIELPRASLFCVLKFSDN